MEEFDEDELDRLARELEREIAEKEEREWVIQCLHETYPNAKWPGLEIEQAAIEQRFIRGEITSKEAAAELLKMTLMVCPVGGSC